MHLLPKNVTKQVYLTFEESFKNFLSCVQKKLCDLRDVKGLPGEAVERTSGYARSYMCGLAKVFFGCRTVFSKFFAFAILYYHSHHLQKLPQVCGILPQFLLSSHVTIKLNQKSLVEFVENFYRKRAFWQDFCLRNRFSLLNT